MTLSAIISLGTQIITLAGIIVSGIVSISKVFSGQRCLLRSEMLRIYYKHKDERTIRQYEFENFALLYGAYKKLHGNSFIDKIYEDVKQFDVTQ